MSEPIIDTYTQYIYKDGKYCLVSGDTEASDVKIVESLPIHGNENTIYIIEEAEEPEESSFRTVPYNKEEDNNKVLTATDTAGAYMWKEIATGAPELSDAILMVNITADDYNADTGWYVKRIENANNRIISINFDGVEVGKLSLYCPDFWVIGQPHESIYACSLILADPENRAIDFNTFSGSIVCINHVCFIGALHEF